jgi:hypothetical protein
MNLDLLIANLKNPALLFFVLGLIAVYVKSDLKIPDTSSKFISMYLLFSIGFNGGQELAHEILSLEILWLVVLAIFSAIVIPTYTFQILRRKMTVYDAGAVAASYGSVSAVTFITAVAYLESMDMAMNGYMVAIMALMESPAIIAGLILISIHNIDKSETIKKRQAIKHSITNGSVLLILGSLVIGYLASDEQAAGIQPFTTDLFKGFLAIFLLDMGLVSGSKMQSLINKGWYPIAFAIIIPLINGCIFAMLTAFVSDDVTNRFMFAVLAASASYIAVPAAMKVTVPRANPGLFLPMALAVTFPVNITIGLPIYLSIVQNFNV